ncbi:serine/threonine-protein kinase [Embleya scabrispora]|uniref:serine/threonine-protein kinase n=1 Tax=Embleya scabrispora TaxID=159449 RepID=UPI0003A1C4D5|nr:serine/threonine-protein kinase [Embleya scabrispora]MYS78718.1 protein kinase [Streptomyces sp. SID5474]
MEGLLLDGRYRCVVCIGSGGMGDVWRCRDERIGRDVAVKLLSYAANSGGAPDRFEREARIVGALGSPAIVTVHDFGRAEVGGRMTPYLVMELLAGTALNARLMTGVPVPVADVVAWGSAVCIALEHAHARGVVHRDIKPANVFLCADGSVKVLDFGIARIVEPDAGHTPMTVTGAILGTPHYMSPEQAGGEKADHRSDLYSLGCLLYALVDGQPPFHAESMYGIAMQHLTAPPRPPGLERRELPEDLRQLILALLAKAPEDRPQSAVEVRERLAAIGADSSAGGGAPGGIPAPPRVPPMMPPAPVLPGSAPAPEPAARRRTFVIGAVAAVVALALAIALAVRWTDGDGSGNKGKGAAGSRSGSSTNPGADPNAKQDSTSPAAPPAGGSGAKADAVPATFKEAEAREATVPLMSQIRATDPCAMLDREFPKRFGPVVVETARQAQKFTECQIVASNGGATDLSVRFRVELGVLLTAEERAKLTPVTVDGVALFQDQVSASANTCTVTLPFGNTGFGAAVQVNQHYPNKGSDQAPWTEGCATAKSYAVLIAPKVTKPAPRATAPTGHTLIGKDPCNAIDASAPRVQGWTYHGISRNLPYRCSVKLVNGDSTYTVAISYKRDAEQVAADAKPISVRGMNGIELSDAGKTSFCIASLTYVRETSGTAWDAQLISVDVNQESNKGGATLDTCALADTVFKLVTDGLGG